MALRRSTAGWIAAIVWLAGAYPARAIPILDPTAPNSLALYTLGSIPSIASQYTDPYSYEGMAINGNNLLLAVGNAVSSVQTIWSLPVLRTAGHITGFGGPSAYAQVLAGDPNSVGNILAGGLVVTAQGLLYTTQGYSFVGQYTASTQTSALLDVTGTGAFTGGLQFVPNGFSGAGQLKMSSILGDWYTLNPAGSFGAYTMGSYVRYNVGVGAYSFDYVPQDGAAYTHPSIVLGDASTQRLDAYALDANGNPCTAQGCAPVVHLVNSDLAIGYGIVRDPVSGDILFTTQSNDVWVLSDAPEPSTLLMGLGGLGLLAWRRRRRS